MIIIDPPVAWPKYGLCSHMISTLAGKQGAEELATFAHKIGLKPAWLQKPDTHLEHYDIMRGMINKALAIGAKQVCKRCFVSITNAKAMAMREVANGKSYSCRSDCRIYYPTCTVKRSEIKE